MADLTMKVVVVDSIGDILTEALIRDSHFFEMSRRGWIVRRRSADNERDEMCVEHFQDFLKEVAF